MPTSLDKLRDLLLTNVGKPVSIKRIEAMIGSTWANELNHLRITFKPNVAESLRRSESVWRELYCCQCGAAPGESDEYHPQRSVRMTIGYILDLSQGGRDDPSNLKAICSVCNEGAANLTPDRPSAIKLLSQLRRAKASDQIAVLQWLINKFPLQSKSALDA